MIIAVFDISVAFFHGKVRKVIYVVPPKDLRKRVNWRDLRSTSCGWIYFGDHLLETYSSTQQIVALSTAESEYISITKGAAHTLEVRSAMVEFGMTFNVV